MKALIIGATGAVGKDLLNVLLQDSDYSEVVTFIRRDSGINHPKLKEIITNFDNLETVSEQITGNVLFSCLGTTLKAAGSKENQKHIDYEIPLKFAEIAMTNGVSKIVLLSAYGASTKSSLFYSRIKGKLEQKIQELAYETFIIFRPGLLLRKNTDRIGEKISAGILNFVNWLGLFKRFQPMPTAVLAEKMAKAPKVSKGGLHIIELHKIFRF